LSGWERFLLFLPIPGAVVFGLGPFLFPTTVPRSVGFAGDDQFVLRLAGGGTFAFAIALGLAAIQREWLAARLLAVATVVFSLLAVPVCALEFAAGPVKPIVYALFSDSLLQVVALGWLLLRYRAVHGGPPEVADKAAVGVAGATLVALLIGVLGLLLPHQAAQLFGYKGTDALLYRLAGAETFGYAAMGVLMVRSRNWAEMRLPVVLGTVFTGAGLVAALIALASGGPVLLPAVVLLVTVIVFPAGVYTLVRGPLLVSSVSR
jgi:hypothetical protein